MTDFPMATLVSIYDDGGQEQLILSLGKDVTLFYDTSEDVNDVEREPISFGEDISDGEWHRLSLSVKGNTVTLLLDCKREITKELKRNISESINVNGIVIIGQQLMEENIFLVKLYIVS